MKETVKERADRLMGEVEKEAKTHFTKGEVKALINHFAVTNFAPDRGEEADTGCRAPIMLADLSRGDVFIAKVLGGKVRPWITLHVEDGVVTAVPLSSGESAPNMIKAQCRFWPSNWIGTTIAQFHLEVAVQEVSRPYTNRNHLKEVERHIAANIGMKPYRPRKKTMTEIAETVRAGQ